MQTIIRYFLLALLFTSVASADSLDKPIVVRSREQLMLILSSSREGLSPQAALDFAVSVRAIERRCDDPATGFTKEEMDALCIAMIDGRTPRQIILLAASLMLAESAVLNASEEHTVDGSKLSGDDFARWRDLTSSRSIGIGFVKAYAICEKNI